MQKPVKHTPHVHRFRWLVLLLMHSSGGAHADIHKCVSNDGIEYSDTHCTVGVLVKHSPGFQTIGTTEGLSDRELENLAELDRAYKLSRIESEKRRSAHKKQLLKEHVRRKQKRTRACANAIVALERIRSIKRKGYNAKQSRTLDVQHKLVNEKKRINC